MPTSDFQPIRLLDSDCYYKFIYLMQTVQIQISWLLQKPTDLDLHCLQRQGISGLSRARVKTTLGPSKSGLMSGVVLILNIEYGKCPKLSNTLFFILFWPKFCVLCSCFVKYIIRWQTV